VISDREVWAAALALVTRYDADAALKAARRAYGLLSEGDHDGCVDWVRIIKAIEKLQATEPADGESVQ
jgi:hypothetical protein